MSATQLSEALTIGRRRFLACSSKLEAAAALVMRTRTNDEDRSFMLAFDCLYLCFYYLPSACCWLSDSVMMGCDY